MPSKPYLLYFYPWMPYPRRVIIYLREKGISSSVVTVVPVTDPQLGSIAPAEFSPKPPGSLPILAIPISENQAKSPEDFVYIRQSLAIMNYLDDLCDAGLDGFPKSAYPMRGAGILGRARDRELLSITEECMPGWNPVRLFGSGLGTMAIPVAAMESLRWIHRQLATIEGWWKDQDFSGLQKDGDRQVTMAEIVLYGFLEFTVEVYGRDLTQGSGKSGKDVYGGETIQSYPKLREFYKAFKTRDSARLDAAAGEVASDSIKAGGSTWHEGSF